MLLFDSAEVDMLRYIVKNTFTNQRQRVRLAGRWTSNNLQAVLHDPWMSTVDAICLKAACHVNAIGTSFDGLCISRTVKRDYGEKPHDQDAE